MIGWSNIEPDALGADVDDDNQQLALSQAVSLKRIADALEKQNEIAEGITHGPLWNGEPI